MVRTSVRHVFPQNVCPWKSSELHEFAFTDIHAIIAKPIKDLWLCEPTGLELVGVRWLTNISCTRIRITRDRDTEILVRNESGIAHIPASYVSHGYRKWRPSRLVSSRLDSSSPRFESCSRLYTFSLFSPWRGGKICSLYSEQGMLPGILMADLNVKHAGAGSLCTVIFGRLLKFPPVLLA